MKKVFDVPYLGFGIGLRPKHYPDLLKDPPPVDWLEIISENFMLAGGRPLYFLDRFKDHYATIIPHGVSLSIGSSDPLDWEYLKKLKALIVKLNAPWFSDHLCWSRLEGKYMHNLLPLPYTPETAQYVADKIRIVQDFMERPFLIENVSSYVEFTQSQMPEWEFITQISETANCGILLDINNVFVSAVNHGFDPMTYLTAIPPERVIQHHIAGHSDKGDYLLDTHDHEIRDEVWQLYEKSIPIFGDVSLLIERDDRIPDLDELLKERDYAKEIYERATATTITR